MIRWLLVSISVCLLCAPHCHAATLIDVPRVQEVLKVSPPPEADAPTPSPRGTRSRAASTDARPASSGVVNINTASVQELDGLPGIGLRMAQRIVDYREKKGPFKRLDDLMGVQGIGEKNFLKLKPLITIAPPKGEHAGTAQR
jgi:comEA protein